MLMLLLNSTISIEHMLCVMTMYVTHYMMQYTLYTTNLQLAKPHACTR